MTTKTKRPMKISNTGLRRVSGGSVAGRSAPAGLGLADAQASFNRQLLQQLNSGATNNDQRPNPPANEKK